MAYLIFCFTFDHQIPNQFILIQMKISSNSLKAAFSKQQNVMPSVEAWKPYISALYWFTSYQRICSSN